MDKQNLRQEQASIYKILTLLLNEDAHRSWIVVV